MDIKQKASAFAIFSALLLAVCKSLVGFFSGSMAVVASGLDSLSDVFMSGINFFAIKKAAEPADAEHPYGHAKAESISASTQALVIIGSGVFIIYKSVRHFIAGDKIGYSGLDFGVMCLSLAVSFVISIVLSRIGKRTSSEALKADALHYTSDLYSNSAAILAILLAYFTGITFFDLVFAVIVGLILIFSALKILNAGISGLMDRSVPAEIEKEIASIIDDMPFPYAGFHRLRTRFAGSKRYVDFHLLICRKLHIDEAHNMTSEIEDRLEKRVADIDAVIHVEPCDEQECEMTEESCSVRKPSTEKQKR
jgi:ferrous-iron efflux pump FieF